MIADLSSISPRHAVVATVAVISLMWFARHHHLESARLQTDRCVSTLSALSGDVTSQRARPILESGWDATGIKIHLELHTRLAVGIANCMGNSPSNVVEVGAQRNDFFGSVRSQNVEGTPGAGWMSKNVDGVTWEPDTLAVYRQMLPKFKTYIGFGTWVGPTLLYAASQFPSIERVYGIEADPAAFAVVSVNLALNSGAPWYPRVHLQPGGVGPGSSSASTPNRVKMSSASAGNSCSGMAEMSENCGEMTLSWQVNTYPLPALFKQWRINTAADTFVKVDVEAFECTLIPSWIDWLTKLGSGNKPGFFIAFHSYITKCTDAQYDDIARFAALYKTVWRNVEMGKGWQRIPPSEIPQASGGAWGRKLQKDTFMFTDF